MDTFESIRTRRTTRTFSPNSIPEAAIRKIVEAGRLAPSARNLQPWHFVVIQEKDMLKQLAPLCTTGRFIEHASCAVVVVTDPTNSWHEIDGARRAEHGVGGLERGSWDLLDRQHESGANQGSPGHPAASASPHHPAVWLSHRGKRPAAEK